MYVVIKNTRNNRWSVSYYCSVEYPSWQSTAETDSPQDAASVCSWLNGGSQPSKAVLTNTTWIGG